MDLPNQLPELENRLNVLRAERGLSQRKLARRLGIHESTVSRWEAGLQGIPDWRKQDLAEFFAVSVPYLMGWDQPQENANDENGEADVAPSAWLRVLIQEDGAQDIGEEA